MDRTHGNILMCLFNANKVASIYMYDMPFAFQNVFVYIILLDVL